MAATIKDVASACGVSLATVSYVLNNTGAVSSKTRERVLEVARQLDYQPSAVARGLARRRMETLGLVFPYFSPTWASSGTSPATEPYAGPILDGVLSLAVRERQKVLVIGNPGWEDAHLDTSLFRDGQCDGLLLLAPPPACPLVESLHRMNVPLVVVGAWSDVPEISSIDVDNASAAKVLTQHLLEQGHRRIGVLCMEEATHYHVRERLAGYRAALTEAGVTPDPDWIREGSRDPERFPERVHALLALPAERRPTALLCLSLSDTRLTLRALTAMGKRVPEDLSLAAFDEFSDVVPPLTVVRQPLHEIGQRAAAMLLARIRGDAPLGEKILIPTELVVRDSVRRI